MTSGLVLQVEIAADEAELLDLDPLRADLRAHGEHAVQAVVQTAQRRAHGSGHVRALLEGGDEVAQHLEHPVALAPEHRLAPKADRHEAGRRDRMVREP